MAQTRNKKVAKLRGYRDKLILKTVDLEGKIRHLSEILRVIRKALQGEDTLRAYALASDPECIEGWDFNSFNDKNELAKELTLVYKFLITEREFSDQIGKAAAQRDYLRVAALAAEHRIAAHNRDDMLSTWGIGNGFTRKLRQESE